MGRAGSHHGEWVFSLQEQHAPPPTKTLSSPTVARSHLTGSWCTAPNTERRRAVDPEQPLCGDPDTSLLVSHVVTRTLAEECVHSKELSTALVLGTQKL